VDLASWTLGLSLIVVTIAAHTTAVVAMALILEKRLAARSAASTPTRRQAISTVIVRIGTIAVLLAALHGVEGVAWAVAYRCLGVFDSFAQASSYSLAAMTTSESSAVPLASRWQMLAALEAINGCLLFGISTAFLFAVMQVHWHILIQRRVPQIDREN